MQVKLAKAFGQMIRVARKQAGLTQPRLAAACGTGVRYIVDLEKGKPTCELGKALWVALNLGIRFEQLDGVLRNDGKRVVS
jgi:transcriptional regulator with XRE-family HTH domain